MIHPRIEGCWLNDSRKTSTNGQIGVMSAGNASAIGAAIPAYTAPDGFIWIIQGRSFFTGTQANGQALGGAFAGLNLQGVDELIIIHEFFHQLGLIGPDDSNQKYTLANGQTVTGSMQLSQAIRDNCFK